MRGRVLVKSAQGKIKKRCMDVEHNHHEEALAFMASLKSCIRKKNLREGIKLHSNILERGLLENDPYLASTLIRMYAKCGELPKAQQLLDEIPVRNVFSWSGLIAGYAEHGQAHRALDCFEQMLNEGISADAVTFTYVLKACGFIGDIEKGIHIHEEIMDRGFLHNDIILGTALVDMYAKCGRLAKAREVFEKFPVRDAISWSAMISGYAEYGQCQEALSCFEQMQNEGFSPDVPIFVCLLKACGSTRTVEKGKQIHDKVLKQGLLEKDIMLGTALVDMYAKCGLLAKAQDVLDGLPVRNSVSWNALISGYMQQGQIHEALNCLERMKNEGLNPDAVTFACILKTCGSSGAIDKGKQIHHEVLSRDLLQEDIVLGNALVDMYAKCGMLKSAKQALEGLPSRNVISWCTLIAGYAQHGHGREALHCFHLMQSEGFSPDLVTLTCVLKACGNTGAIDKGKQIHDIILNRGLLRKDTMLGIALVDMYAKCGMLAKAQEVLEQLPDRHAVTWNALITGYAQQGLCYEALNCFQRMQSEGIDPDAVTFICILKACGSIGDIEKGTQIHDKIMSMGFLEKNIVLGNALVDMYAKCGVLARAQEVLEELPLRDVVSWNALIAGYAQQGQCHEVLNCFECMQNEGFSPNAVTFSSVLKACSSAEALDKGKQIHDVIVDMGFLEKDVVLATALVDMYAKCGVLCKAEQVLEEVTIHSAVLWNALIAGFVKHGQGCKALDCLEKMQNEGICPHSITFMSVLKACGQIGAIADGRKIHGDIVNASLLNKDITLSTSLMDMYAKWGALAKAQQMHETLPLQNTVSWSALINGYVQQEQAYEALNCFEQMQIQGLSPDAVTLSCILKACGNIGALEKGKQIHDEILRRDLLKRDIVLGTALIDMYAKCGDLAKAQQILRESTVRNVVSWNVLIAGYVQYGQGHKALRCFEWMQSENISVNEVTLLCVLNACNHSGLLHDVWSLFKNMTSEYGVNASIEHHTCMVAILGLSGHFEDAVSMMEMMPSSHYPAVWLALLYACQKWGNVYLGRVAFDQVIQLSE